VFIRVESSSGVPITRQIADQIRSHAASGTLVPGDRLPSVRQLSRELLVNQNTILRVYERLTAEGLLERRQGDGTFVAQNLPRGRGKAQRELLVQQIEQLVHRAIDLGVDEAEIRRLIDTSFARIERSRTAMEKGKP
jgi:GntR family transcriptional regulator